MFNLDYYTTWSNLFFYLILIISLVLRPMGRHLPGNLVVFAAVNMIMVGIVGNIIFNFNMPNIIHNVSGGKDIHAPGCRKIGIINMIMHTLPMLIAILWLYLVPQSYDTRFVVGAVVGLLAVWSVVPDNKGKFFLHKADNEYGDPKWYIYLLLPLVLALILWILQLKR